MGKGAEMTKLKGGRLVSPVGTARYAYIGKPDSSTYGKGRFRITVVFDKADPEFVSFAKKIAALSKLHEAGTGRKASGLPIKLVNEKMSKGKDGKSGTGDPVGTPYMEFVANGTYKDKQGNVCDAVIRTFNAKAQEENCLVYGGDTVRVNCTIMGWEMPDGVGVKGYLNTVQQLKSNWTGGGSGFSDMSDEYGEDEAVEEETDDGLEDEGGGFEDETEERPPVQKGEFADDPEPEEAAAGDPLDSLLG